MEPWTRESHEFSWRTLLLLIGFGSLVLGVRLGSYRVLTLHEILFAQPAKEMLESGNWIHPTIGGHASDHKPPLTHWSIALAMTLFQSESAWVVRFPNALASVVSTLLIASMVARWRGERIGLWTGLVHSSSLFFLLQGRLAESDMLLCATVTLAYWCFSRGCLDSPVGQDGRRWLPWLFHAACVMAFLTKGPVALVVIFGGCGTFLLWNRDRNGWRFLLDPVGMLVLVVGVVSWPLAALLTRPEILFAWRVHHWDRFLSGLDGHKDPLFYFYNTPYMLLPWTPLAVIGIVFAWRKRKETADKAMFDRLLALWFLCGFAVLSASAFKHKHYLIPILPPLCAWAGLGVEKYRLLPPRHWESRLLGGLILILGLVGLGAIYITGPDFKEVAVAAITLATLGFAGAVLLRSRSQGYASLTALFLTVGVVGVSIQGYLMPYFDDYGDQTKLANRINHAIPENESIYMVDLGETQMVYYLRAPYVRGSVHELAETLRTSRPPVVHVVGTLGSLPELARFGSVDVLDRCASIRPYMKESEWIVLARINVSSAWRSASGSSLR